MSVKVIAFEVDDTLWSGQLDERKWGKGLNAASRIQDSLERVDDRLIRDRRNHRRSIKLFRDVPNIVHDAVKRGIKLAIVSNNSNKELVDRALYWYQANDANDNPKGIIFMITYDEVGNGKIDAFKRIREWSGISYNEMVLFDCNHASKEVHDQLGVKFELVSGGLDWDTYKKAVGGGGSHPSDSYDSLFYGQPTLGRQLGEGKFSNVYDSVDDSQAVIKVLKIWTEEMRRRFLEIYSIVKHGKPLKPGSKEDKDLLMIALELRNLDRVQQLKAPRPENFTGWFLMTKIEGVPLWKTPLYKKHPFSVTFQQLIRTGFHLAMDEIEASVKKYGVEHCDAHLANVYFTVQGDQPVKAHLLDWGIAVLMTWDGHQYVRGDDVFSWSDSEAGCKYTPEEFRKYWIKWMVKTEYEANMSRHAITEKDGQEFLKDIDWWYCC